MKKSLFLLLSIILSVSLILVPVKTFAANSNYVVTGKIGTVSGKQGATITVPVSFDAVPASGINNCDFNVGYDASKLEVISVNAGEIVTNPAVNFTKSLSTAGKLVLLFGDNTQGSQSITKTGVFANITFKIKSTAVEGDTAVTINSIGSFSDKDLKNINVSIAAGKVTVK